jgi:hypothetical protein
VKRGRFLKQFFKRAQWFFPLSCSEMMRTETWASDSRQPGSFDDYIMAARLEPPLEERGGQSRLIL